MARGNEGESVNEIRALLVKSLCLRSISGTKKYHSLEDSSTQNLWRVCKRNITPLFHIRAKFFSSLAYSAVVLRPIHANVALFKPG
jgi:hypothetical protein